MSMTCDQKSAGSPTGDQIPATLTPRNVKSLSPDGPILEEGSRTCASIVTVTHVIYIELNPEERE